LQHREPRRVRGLPRTPSRRRGSASKLRTRAPRSVYPTRRADLPAPCFGAARATGAHMIAVIFEVEPKDGRVDDYLGIAKDLRPLLDGLDGFISIERFESLTQKGKILSLSFWRDEAAVSAWRNLELHRRAQAAGRSEIFRDYRLRIAEVVRDYGMNERAEAPKDSRARNG